MPKREYEWVYEELDADGEIVDVQHSDVIDRLPEVRLNVALRVDCELYGRGWAYVQDNKLPPMLLDAMGRKVCLTPRKYQHQLRQLVRQKQREKIAASRR